VDEDTGSKIVKILLLNPKLKKKNHYPNIQKWRNNHADKQEQMRGKMRQLGVNNRNVERVLHYMYGAGGHVFPEDMHQAVDKFHSDQGWADYMQCTAKCTTCDVPCCTSAKFGNSVGLESQVPRTGMELSDELRRQIEHTTFYKKLMLALRVNVFTAMSLQEELRLK